MPVIVAMATPNLFALLTSGFILHLIILNADEFRIHGMRTNNRVNFYVNSHIFIEVEYNVFGIVKFNVDRIYFKV